ncbi:hypothetical protein L7F22_012544 [Adiantum nelumboides]|nr:hypothetical protein [Adiantum nelumboides]
MDPRVRLTEKANYHVKYLDEALRRRSLVRRFISSSPLRQRGRVSDWVQAALSPTEQKQRIIKMDRGLFIVIMVSERAAHSLAACLPLSMGRCILFGVPYYDQFDVDSLDEMQQIPKFPIKLCFPDLQARFEVPSVLHQFGSVLSTPFRDYIDVDSST